MHISKKLSLLNQIYTIFDRCVGTLNTACKKGCSHCCTINVTLTTLEAHNILNAIDDDQKNEIIEKFNTKLYAKRFQPKITTNQIAQFLIENKDLPDEENNSLWGKCPLLYNDICLIYDTRPFACRCMLSEQECKNNGFASLDPFIVTVNNIFMQYIEHIDSDGFYGNFTDIFLFTYAKQNNRQDNKSNLHFQIIPNRIIKMLLVPPEHTNKIKPIIAQLNQIN